MTTEAAVKHAPVAQAIPALQYPLRQDPKPRACPREYHLYLPPAARDQLAFVVDSYVDGRKQ